MANKKSVIVREQFIPMFESVTDEQAGKLIKAMLAYQTNGEANFDDPLMTAIFAMLRESIDRDNAEYEAVCEKRRQAARGRWDDTTESKSMQVDANASKSTICNASDADMDMELDKDTLASKDAESKKRRFTPPSASDVRAYCEEKGYKVDAEAFVDFYAAKGWKVGNQPMKDWKAAVRTWTRRESSAPPGKVRQYHNRYNDFPQRDNDYDKIQDDWIRASFGK